MLSSKKLRTSAAQQRYRTLLAGEDPVQVLRAVKARHWIRVLPSELDAELAAVCDNVAMLKVLVNEAAALMREARPRSRALPQSFVAYGAGAYVAWQSALSEAAKVGPPALMALLLVARQHAGTNRLPHLEASLLLVLSAKAP